MASPPLRRLIFPLTGRIRLLIIAELAWGRKWNRNLEPNFCPGRSLNPEPHNWQSSTLTTRLPRTRRARKRDIKQSRKEKKGEMTAQHRRKKRRDERRAKDRKGHTEDCLSSQRTDEAMDYLWGPGFAGLIFILLCCSQRPS